MHPYVLETERLLLRALSPEDAEAAFVWCGDPQVNRFMPYSLYTRVEDVRVWLTTAADAQWEFGFVRRRDGLLMGSGGVSPGEKPGDPWEVGYNLRRDCWGRGYATEAARAMIGFAFRTFGVRDFCANHARANAASGHVMRRCGMVFDHEGEYARFDGSEVFPADFYHLHLDRSGQAHTYRFVPMAEAQLAACRAWGYPLPRMPEDGRFAVLDEAEQLSGAVWYLPEEGMLTMYPALCPERTGLGGGEQFIRACVAFGRERFGRHLPVQLDAGAYSDRGRAACLQAGFRPADGAGRLVLAP
ncbi:MAG: GNAT family N-acetyltransferase [Aristaeellaceae bacterium]